MRYVVYTGEYACASVAPKQNKRDAEEFAAILTSSEVKYIVIPVKEEEI